MYSPKPLQRQEVAVVYLGEELLLRPPDGKATHVLNQTARLIWELCDGEHTAEDIEAAVRARFATPPDQDVLEDVRRILRIFDGHGLLASDSVAPALS